MLRDRFHGHYNPPDRRPQREHRGPVKTIPGTPVGVPFLVLAMQLNAGNSARGRGHRVRVFVDFWNYELSMQRVDATFRTDWSRMGPVLSREAIASVDSRATDHYQGLNLYGSFNPDHQADRNLLRWATTVVSTFPGVSVSMVPRQKRRSPPSCPTCHVEIATCPRCAAALRGTEEKGVDVRMATEMISLAWADNYDIAVLVTSDQDLVPVAEFLGTRGIKVIHGAFPPQGSHLTQRCWGSISIPGLREELGRANRRR